MRTSKYRQRIRGRHSENHPRQRTWLRPVLEELEPRLAPATIGLAPVEVPFALVGEPYSQGIQAFGPKDSSGPYAFVATPSNVDGLSFSTQANTLTLSGTPTAAGSFPFTVNVSDSNRDTGSASYILVVATPVGPGITLTLKDGGTNLPPATAGSPYGQVLLAAGGNGTYTFTPPASVDGLTFFTHRDKLTLSGTPTSAGSFAFTVDTQDTAGNNGSQAFTLNVAMSIAPTQSNNVGPGIINQTYRQVITPTGGIGKITFVAPPSSVGGLPVTVTDDALIISGTPTTANSFPFTVTAQDSANHSVTANYILGISAAPVTFTALSPVSGVNGSQYLTPGQVRQPYSQSFQAAGGNNNLTVVFPSGAANGLTFTANGPNLTLAGMPSDSGNFSYILYAQDSNGITSPVQTFFLNIAPAPSPASLTLVGNVAQNLPSAVQGRYYSQTFRAFGGTTYSFSNEVIVNDKKANLPPGLSFAQAGATDPAYVLSGTPTSSGSVAFKVTVTSGSSTVTQQFVLTIQPAEAAPLTLTRSSIQPGVKGDTFNQQLVSDQQSVALNGNYSQFVPYAFTASGGSSGNYVFSALGLPPGMYVASNGLMGGTPAQSGTFPVTVTVTDQGGHQASRLYPMTILPQYPFPSTPPTIYRQILSPAQVRHAYGFDQIILSGGIIGDGSNQTIGVIEFGDQPTFASSISTFAAPKQVSYSQSDMFYYNSYLDLPQFGSALGQGAPVFLKLSLQYDTTYPATTSDSSEWAQDVETIHALAPMANIVVFVAGSYSLTNYVAAMQAALNFSANMPPGLQGLPPVTVLSSSWGQDNEYFSEVNDVASYQSPDPANFPATVVIAAGDTGYFPPSLTGPQFPAIAPNVVSAAMTQLTTDSNGNYIGELGVSNAGGGPSLYLPQPPYQAGVVDAFSTTQRVGPDVGIIGSYNAGMPALVNGDWFQADGSSNAAPAWTALLAIVNQARIAAGQKALNGPTQTLPMLYQLPAADFNKITQLDDGTIVPGAYNTSVGLGTPVANRIVAGLAGGHDIISGRMTRAGTSQGLQGWVVFFDANGNNTPDANEGQTLTDATGGYSFLVAPGSYPLAVVPRPGWTMTSTPPGTITFVAGADKSAIVNFQFASPAILVTGAGQGGGPEVNVYNPDTRAILAQFFAFDAGFVGGTRVAAGDVTGDGIPDVVAGAGPGGGPNVRVFDGMTFQPLGGFFGSFFPFDTAFSGGVYVAAGDVNGDGFADVICGADAGGGPNVVTFSGKDGSQLVNFFAFDPAFSGGVRVAAGDIDGDGKAEIICGAGVRGGPNVTVFNQAGAMMQSFFPFDPAFTGGVYVGAGDLNGDGKADVVAGAGAGGGPTVSSFDLSGPAIRMLSSFFAYDSSFTGGVRVGATTVNGGGTIVTAPGAGGGPQIRAFNPLTGNSVDSFFAYNPLFTGGVFVGGV